MHYRSLLAVVTVCILLSTGCAYVAPGTISAVEKRHDVSIDVSPGAMLCDFLGGNTYLLLKHVDEDLEHFPPAFKQGLQIHLASKLEFFGRLTQPEDLVIVPFGIAYVVDSGKERGHIVVTNRTLPGAYMDLFSPITRMYQDSCVRHEIIHAYEINNFQKTILPPKWQARLAQYDTMDQLRRIDSISFAAARESGTELLPYAQFCADWLAASLGDVNKDKRIDAADAQAIGDRYDRYDLDKDGLISYDEAAEFSAWGYTNAHPLAPLVQAKMTLEIFGYRPRGFASVYASIYPYEDKAETLRYAVEKNMIPEIISDGGGGRRAQGRLAALEAADPVLGRKVRVLADFFARLEGRAIDAPPRQRTLGNYLANKLEPPLRSASRLARYPVDSLMATY